jgi:virginiamycin B lyase
MKRLLGRLLLVSLATLAATLLVPAVAPAAITEYPIPTPASRSVDITAGPDGALWFTESDAGKIGRVTTTGSFSEFELPTPSFSAPYGITAGPDGALWFTESSSSANKIGRVTTTGSFSEFTIPTPSSEPRGITAGPDGALWFVELSANKIGRVTTTGSFSEFTIPTASSLPIEITAGPDGALWFTEFSSSANKIGRVTTTGSFSEFTIPTASGNPNGITAGPDGALWFTEQTGNKIGRVTTTGSFSEFPLPTPGSVPIGITAGPDGALWFTEFSSGANKIGRLTTTGSLSEFPIPTPSSGPNGITAGPDAAVWFTESTPSANKIGRIDAGPGAPASLALAPDSDTNTVGSEHCVTATVTDGSGNPTPNVTVRFSASGANSASGQATTDADGKASFCYTGALPGTDTITAFADTNDSGFQDAGEPSDTATKTWILPSGTALCVVKIINGGEIVTDDGDRASFAGTAKESSSLVASGNEYYQDHGPAEPLQVKSIAVQALTCNSTRTEGTVFGTATINRQGVHNFRIDVQDLGEPGKNKDHYRIRLDTGYDSGDHVLRDGNVQIR